MSETDDPTPPPGIRVLGQPSGPPPDPTDPTDPTDPADPADPTGAAADAEGRAADVPGPVRPGALLGLVIVAILGIAGTITFGLLWAGARSQGPQAVEAGSRTVAQQFLRDFTTFNPSTVTRTFADIQSMSTGSFATQAKVEFSASLRQQLQAANASTQGQVRYLQLQAYTHNSASYYADVVQTYSNNKTNGPQSDELRLVVALALTHGHWKISGVTSLDTPAVPRG